MLHRLLNKLRPSPSALRAQERLRYLEARRPYAYAPYDAGIYGTLLRQLRANGEVEFASFRPRHDAGGKVRLHLRHDVDTATCVNNLPLLLELNLAEGVAATVYLRTDGVEYAPREATPVVTRYRANGVIFGLHTSCYAADDCFGALRGEIDRFVESFGFQPSTFTVHGLGTFRAETRGRFNDEIGGRLREFGFDPEQAPPPQYDYVIQDCHLETGTQRRYVYDDIITLPRFFEPGRDYLVLTHPCYWR